jgi:CDP-paratose 2-epimerase
MAGQDRRLDYLFHTNLTGAFNCLEKAREWKSRFLFLSTSRVYPISKLEAQPWREEGTRFIWENGDTAGITSRGVNETLDMTGARSLYGYTKFATELLIEEYRNRWGLKAVVDRCGVIAGPWQFGKVDQGVASLWVMAHHFGLPLNYIGYGGAGKQVRDFLHIADLLALVVEQVGDFDHWDGWVGNVAGGLEVSASLAELTTLCREVTGREVSIPAVATNRADDLRIFIGDCSRLHERTSWRPKHSMREIVSDIRDWIFENESLLAGLPR